MSESQIKLGRIDLDFTFLKNESNMGVFKMFHFHISKANTSSKQLFHLRYSYTNIHKYSSLMRVC